MMIFQCNANFFPLIPVGLTTCLRMVAKIGKFLKIGACKRFPGVLISDCFPLRAPRSRQVRKAGCPLA
jgi:hypothetical protein